MEKSPNLKEQKICDELKSTLKSELLQSIFKGTTPTLINAKNSQKSIYLNESIKKSIELHKKRRRLQAGKSNVNDHIQINDLTTENKIKPDIQLNIKTKGHDQSRVQEPISDIQVNNKSGFYIQSNDDMQLDQEPIMPIMKIITTKVNEKDKQVSKTRIQVNKRKLETYKTIINEIDRIIANREKYVGSVNIEIANDKFSGKNILFIF